MRLVVLLVAALCLGLALAKVDRAVVGAFNSAGARRAAPFAPYNHATKSWASLHASIWDFPAGADSSQYAVSHSGDVFWWTGSDSVSRYRDINNGAAPTGGVTKVRLGNANGVFSGTFGSLGVSADGNTLWVCGDFNNIGNTDTDIGHNALYEFTDLDGSFSWAAISPNNEYPVECDTLEVFENNVLLRASQGPSAGTAPEYFYRVGGTWQQVTANGSVDFFRFSNGALYAYASNIDGSEAHRDPVTNVVLQTVQKWTGPGATWTALIEYSAFNDGVLLRDFVVGDSDLVYLTFSNSVSNDQVTVSPTYVYLATGGSPASTFSVVAPSYFFTPGATYTPKTDFQLWYDPALQAVVVFGVNYVTYAPEDLLAEPEQLHNLYTKAVSGYVALVPGSDPTAASAYWQAAYGGGSSPVASRLLPGAGRTYLYFDFDVTSTAFTYDVVSGPVILDETWNNYTLALADAVDSRGFSLFNGNPNTNQAASLRAVAYASNLGLVVGGYFTTISADGGSLRPVNSLTVFNVGQSSLNNALGSGLDVGVRVSTSNDYFLQQHQSGQIYDIYVDENAKFIYVGGKFDTAGAFSAANVARYGYGSSGSGWTDLDGGLTGEVYAITKYKDDIVFAGDFTRVGLQISTYGVAGWNTKSNTWVTYNRGVDNGAVFAATVWRGKLVIGGEFTSVSGVQVDQPRIAVWDGDVWSALRAYTTGTKSIACGSTECESVTDHVYTLLAWGKRLIFTSSDNIGYNLDLNLYLTGDGFYTLSSQAIEYNAFAHPITPGPKSELLAVFNTPNSAESSNFGVVNVENTNFLYTPTGVNGGVYDTFVRNAPSSAAGLAASLALIVALLAALL